MAFTNQPYCTRADVKLALDPTMGTQDDSFIDTLIVNAQSDLDSEIGYSFQQDGTTISPATRVYDGDGGRQLMIDPIVSLTSAIETIHFTYQTINGIWVSGTTTTNDVTADIVLKPNNYAARGEPAYMLVRSSGMSFVLGTQNYTIHGVFGFPIVATQTYPGVPNDVSRACIRLAVHYYKMRDTAYSDMVQAQGGIREKYIKDWPDDVKRTVRNHQRNRFFHLVNG